MGMVAVAIERRVIACFADPSFVTFVAKTQKAKTRKNKNYFVLRATVPKEVAEKLAVKAGDYLLFRTKKAQWYHLLEWDKMASTWNMLPDEIRQQIISDGLYQQGYGQTMLQSENRALGATNPSASPNQQSLEIMSRMSDLCGSNI